MSRPGVQGLGPGPKFGFQLLDGASDKRKSEQDRTRQDKTGQDKRSSSSATATTATSTTIAITAQHCSPPPHSLITINHPTMKLNLSTFTLVAALLTLPFASAADPLPDTATALTPITANTATTPTVLAVTTATPTPPVAIAATTAKTTTPTTLATTTANPPTTVAAVNAATTATANTATANTDTDTTTSLTRVLTEQNTQQVAAYHEIPTKTPTTTIAPTKITITDLAGLTTSADANTYVWVTTTLNGKVFATNIVYSQKLTAMYQTIQTWNSGTIGLGSIDGKVGKPRDYLTIQSY